VFQAIISRLERLVNKTVDSSVYTVFRLTRYVQDADFLRTDVCLKQSSPSCMSTPPRTANMIPFRALLVAVAFFAAALSQPQATFSSHSADACASLEYLSLTGTLILEVGHVTANQDFPVPGSGAGSCNARANTTVDICRVHGIIKTSSGSSSKFEIWLPMLENWYGRFLSTGNGGTNGCESRFNFRALPKYHVNSDGVHTGIDYSNLEYGTSLHFATVGVDGGHEGFTAVHMLNHPEVIHDFSHRAVHDATVIGKEIAKAYYAKAPARSYYLGCSAGGRQGMQSALMYPYDYDGIVAGAPAVDWNHFIGAQGITAKYFSGDRFISDALWSVVNLEVYKQCDELDGLADQILADPEVCHFNPEPLDCKNGHGESKDCLTPAQVEALRELYKPIHGTDNQLLWPRFDPGSEKYRGVPLAAPMIGDIQYTLAAVSVHVSDAVYSFC
jgi:feruloyl esterase